MKQATAQSGCKENLSARRASSCLRLAALAWVLGGAAAAQQPASPEDAAVDQICQLAQINEGDQQRIADWVQAQVDRLSQVPKGEQLEAANKFRERFKTRLRDSKCTAAFRQEFPAQTSRVAEGVLANPSTATYVAYALARVLLEMDLPATARAQLACLKSQVPAARYLCARGLNEQRSAIISDKSTLEVTLPALRDAGIAEQDPTALAQIYRALGFTNQPGAVLDHYMAIFDRRIRDGGGAGNFVADGAETEAFAFFGAQGVLGGLNANQKQQLVVKLAEFMRLYAARYDTAGLEFEEVDRLERLLHQIEALLDELVDKDGGTIRQVLASQGYAGRASVAAEAYKWIGDAQSKTPGVLNAAPWNVPLGGSAQAEASARAAGSTD